MTANIGGARAALGDDTTHVLQFGPFCGASLRDRLRGKGLWDLMTAAEYNRGAAHGGRRDWAAAARKGTPLGDLTAWVSDRTGYPVTLTRDDELIDPAAGWLAAYRVTRAAS
jgi:hypothetical protein